MNRARLDVRGGALGAILAGVLCGAPAAAQEAADTVTLRLESATIQEIQAAVEAGALTSTRLVELYLARIAAYDARGPALNAVITLNPDALRTAARLDAERRVRGPRGPMHGIPVVVKDNYNTVEMPTTAGSVTLRGSVPPDDAFAVARLREAGAIVLGKVNLSEFATPAGRGAYSSLHGVTRNPYHLRRDPSGSSGGTGAAIAANFAAVGLGTDTGGSIRGPAAANGLVGIRPTYGLVSRMGIVPQAPSLDTAGPMARTVMDAAIALGVMAQPDPDDPAIREPGRRAYRDYTRFLDADALRGARIGVARDFFGGDPEVDARIDEAIRAMERLGATVVDGISFDPEFLRFVSGLRADINAEFRPGLEAYLATLGEGYPRTLAEVIALSESPAVVGAANAVNPGLIATHRRNLEIGGLENPAYRAAIEQGLPRVRRTLLQVLDGHRLDALVYPTARCPAQPLYDVEDPGFRCRSGPSGTTLASYAGFPDVQVPAGFTRDGLPTTISFVGRRYSEPELLALAYAFEQATRHRRPPPLVPPLPGETIRYVRPARR